MGTCFFMRKGEVHTAPTVFCTLSVSAPAGSTIEVFSNDAIIDTYIMQSDQTKCAFELLRGEYTIRGSLDGKSQYHDVVLTRGLSAITFENYVTWLYRYGDECASFTGGWSESGRETAHGTYVVDETDNRIYLKATGTDGYGVGLTYDTANYIGMMNYKKICFDVAIKQTDPYERDFIILVGDQYASGNKIVYKSSGSANVERTVIEYAVAGMYGNHKVRFHPSTVNPGNYCEITLYRCWLE